MESENWLINEKGIKKGHPHGLTLCCVLFVYLGANRYYYMCMNEFLALGGGGNFALCLDGDL